MKITTLVENSPGDHKSLGAEHGISFFIEPDGGGPILFDTGQTGLIVDNARYLNKSLENIGHIILSHGHYDHTGGLLSVLCTIESTPDIHVGNGFFVPKYSVGGAGKTYLGPDFAKSDLVESGCRVIEHSEDGAEIAPDVFLVTNFNRRVDSEWPNTRFVVPGSEPGQWETDPFTDEVSVVLTTKKGLVLLVGCSHPGILNIIETVENRFSQPLFGVVGGTHLGEAHGGRLTKILDYFQKRPELILGLSHCTGATAMEEIQKRCPGYYHNCTGVTLFVD